MSRTSGSKSHQKWFLVDEASFCLLGDLFLLMHPFIRPALWSPLMKSIFGFVLVQNSKVIPKRLFEIFFFSLLYSWFWPKSLQKQRYGSKQNFYFLFSKILTHYVFTLDFLRQLFQNRFFKLRFFKTEYLIFQILLKTQNSIVSKKIITKSAIRCSKLTIETLEQGAKYVQRLR